MSDPTDGHQTDRHTDRQTDKKTEAKTCKFLYKESTAICIHADQRRDCTRSICVNVYTG